MRRGMQGGGVSEWGQPETSVHKRFVGGRGAVVACALSLSLCFFLSLLLSHTHTHTHTHKEAATVWPSTKNETRCTPHSKSLKLAGGTIPLSGVQGLYKDPTPFVLST